MRHSRQRTAARRAAACALALVTGLSCAPPPEAGSLEALAALRRELADADATRPLAGRLSIDTLHRPCATESDDRAPRSGRTGPSDDALARQARARGRALRALRDDRRPGARHLLAMWWLIADPAREDLARARERLEEAIALDPDVAEFHSDLAVVLLSAGDPTLRPAALEHARTARELAPDDRAARWNEALAAGALGLARLARRSWDGYLELAPDEKGWAAEARRHRGRIVEVDLDQIFADRVVSPPASPEAARELVGDHPDRVTGYLLETLLPDYARAVARGDAGAARELQQSAALVAAALREILGDDGGRQAMERVESSAVPGAFEAYARGRAALRDDELAAAETKLREVLRREPEPASPWAAWSRVWLALIAIYRGEHDRCDELLDAVERSIDLERQPTLAGRVLWHRGLSLARRGLDGRSVPTLRRAEALFERLGDRRNTASIQLMLSEDLTALGRPREAWELRLRALRGLAGHPRAIPLHNTLLTVAQAARDDDRPRAARAFAEEAVELAEASEDPISIAEARELLARLAAAEGRRVEAARHFGRAEEAVATIGDDAFRRNLGAKIALARATWLPEETTDNSGPDSFTPLLAFYRERSLHHKVIEVLLERSRWRLRTRDDNGAIEDLETALALLVDKNRTLDGVGDRLAHSEVVHAVFETLVAHHVDHGDATLALAYAECARLAPYRQWAYPRLGLPTGADCHALVSGLEARRAALQPGETWLAFLARADELLVWTIDRDGIRVDRRAITRRELRRRIEMLERAVDPDDVSAASRALWPLLGIPSGENGVATRLAVVPDAVLAPLPFAALRDPGSGRWLIEDATISLAVQVAPRGAGIRPAGEALAGSALLVADPAFDPTFGDFESLDAARAEIDAIARRFDGPRVLAGAAATREAILGGLQDATVFHFAGHAVANADDPFRSYLLLAAPGNPPEQLLLRADELLGVELGALRLVVLSACETAATAAGRTAPAAALAGLAMPFLLRADAEVVATLRSVDDRDTARLMPRLYRHLAAGLSTAEALRAAQLELLHDDDPAARRPAAWAWVVAVE